MDGNRRYGKMKWGNALKGHWAGGDKLNEFTDWCIKHGVQMLTVYAFSTENWNRSQEEVDGLMDIFECYTAKIKADSMAKGMRVKLVSTDASRLPAKTMAGLRELERTTQHNSRFTLNLCVSY